MGGKKSMMLEQSMLGVGMRSGVRWGSVKLNTKVALKLTPTPQKSPFQMTTS